MSNDKKGKSIFSRFFGKGSEDSKSPSSGLDQSANYGNHVSRNYGTVTQVGGGNSSRTKSGMVFGEARTVAVNGREFTGRKIERVDGRILIDGRDVTDEVATPASELLIVVQGDVSKLEIHGSQQVTINGNAGSVTATTGSITVTGNVTGSVESATGSITCGKVGGNVNAVMGCVYPSRS